MPSKASESSHNKPFTYFDEAMARSQNLTFDQNLENALSN